MRSRYTAYATRAYAHLESSLTSEEQKGFSKEEAKKWAENSEWLGFTLLRTERGGPEDDEGIVEFSARFRADGKDHEHHEASRFIKEDGRWLYAGSVPAKAETYRREAPKIGRNDPCPCGSGKKFKKCCGAAA